MIAENTIVGELRCLRIEEFSIKIVTSLRSLFLLIRYPYQKKLSEDQEALSSWSFFVVDPPNQQQGK